MFALMPFMENFDSFTETIRMKYTLALLPGQQFNTGGKDTFTCYDQHWKTYRESPSKAKFYPLVWFYGNCGNFIALAYERILKVHERGCQQNWILILP